MKNKFTLMLFASIALTNLFISCDKDEDPELIEEQELITTVVLNITSDSANNPLYLNSIWTASSAGTGTARVYLIHEPTTKTSTSRGGFGGETDVEVDFTVVIFE